MHDTQDSLRRTEARRVLVVILFVIVAVGGVAVGGGAAAASESSAPTAVYENGSGTLTVLYTNGTTRPLGVAPSVTGPLAEVDGDAEMEAPFVADGALKAVEPDGDVTTLVASGVGTYALAVGDWDGDGHRAVFYSEGKLLHRLEVSSGETQGFGVKSKGTGGLGDLDGDDAQELAFKGSSGQLRYVDDDGTTTKTSWYAYGIGTPRDFDGDGNARVPVVGGSGHVALVDVSSGGVQRFGETSAVKTSIGLANVTGDASVEVLYLETVNSPVEIKYVTLAGAEGFVHNASGGRVVAGKQAGVAGVLAVPPRLSEYAVTNPSGRTVRVAFNATVDLADIEVGVAQNGTRVATLTEANVTETGGGPFHYVGTYTATTDGRYTATVTRAVGENGLTAETTPSESLAVQTPTPTVTNVTITDRTDGNSVVDAGDRIRVTASVGHNATLTAVTANLSAFGVDENPVSFTEVDGRWVANATVGDDAVEGARRAVVTATNEYDHTDRAESGTLVVDTTPPVLDVATNRTVDEDTKVTFDADSTDATEVDYTWELSSSSTATGERVTHVFGDPGSYTVTVTATDTAGNANTSTITVDVRNVTDTHPVPAVTNVTLTDVSNRDGVVTAGDAVRVTGEVRAEAAISAVTADLSMLDAGTVTLTRSGSRWVATSTVGADASSGVVRASVTAVNEYGNAAANESEPMTVDAAAPTVAAVPDRAVDEDTPTVFDADSTDVTAVSYTWTFPDGFDGSTGHGERVTHTFTQPGIYTVTLTATDAVGHVATTNVSVDVRDVTPTTKTVTKTVTKPVDHDRTRMGSDVLWHTTATLDGDANVSLRFENQSLHRLTFHGPVPVGNVTVEGLGRPPANASDAPGVVFHAFYVNVPWSDRASTATMRVTVPLDPSLDANHVYLARLGEGGWTLHDADPIETAGKRTVFGTRTPGFSVVAVVYYPGGDVPESAYVAPGETDTSTQTTTTETTQTTTTERTSTAADTATPAADGTLTQHGRWIPLLVAFLSGVVVTVVVCRRTGR